MRLALAVALFLAAPILLASFWPFRVSFDELTLMIAASMIKGMWLEAWAFAELIGATFIILGVLALWQILRS